MTEDLVENVSILLCPMFLTHFTPMFHYSMLHPPLPPLKYQKTSGVLMSSQCIVKEHLQAKGLIFYKLNKSVVM